ncbi:hypothetical protein AVEN_221265-1 [Araneus ventricosus]|uniref:DUF7041 domain-containing protein n=1 Tax=Araneus ventricosus TaxID=182803 RepID=A0A4Y2B1S7_ARAVE|nr:hypothetical protein AVEN_221265-1 [Araneus ventricosus]
MEEISAVKIPPFNFADLQLWFIMVEATFELAVPKPITSSITTCNYCVAHIAPEAAAIVRDIIVCPDKADLYTHLKEIKRCIDSTYPRSAICGVKADFSCGLNVLINLALC